jgi:tetratricopeptide (TPR) repeat protein
VFEGGAFEDDLLVITELEPEQWNRLRSALEGTGLLQAEVIPGVTVPHLRFHPTLAPVLWRQVAGTEQETLQDRHGQRYYALSRYLYIEDNKNPLQARAIVQRELPNLLKAVHRALDRAEDWAVDFVDKVNQFLNFFSLNQDRAHLTQRAQEMETVVGSEGWFLSRYNQGRQLLIVGHFQEALQVFESILAALPETPSYNCCLTLKLIGNCLARQGQTTQAAARYRQALEMAGQLEARDLVKRQVGALQADLADVLMKMGDYKEAKTAYEASSEIATDIGDFRMVAVAQGQLGALALVKGDLPQAQERYQSALTTFQHLNEPAAQAIAWNQLGNVHGKAGDWVAAEQAYRESAKLEEAQGNLAGAARAWNNLAVINQGAGNLVVAEAWYRKGIEAYKQLDNPKELAIDFSNLANLLQSQPNRLPEAQHLAEQALAIDQTLDPAAAEIWTIYTILAEIADKQNNSDPARTYRRQARQAKAAFAGTQYELQRFVPLIEAVVTATTDPTAQQELEANFPQLAEKGFNNLVQAIEQILAGQRDEDQLCEQCQLDLEDSMVIMAILQSLNQTHP